MPTYEYQCRDCEQHFEYVHRMSDDPMSVCENCGGKLKRLVSAAAFHLKGGGWYKDLYSSPKPGSDKSTGDQSGDKAGAKSGDSAEGGDKSGTAKSESKASGSGSSTTKSGGD